MRKFRKRCAICGREYNANRPNGKYCPECRAESMRRYKREWYHTHGKKPDGVRRGADGRLYEHRGYAKKIYWTGQMLSDLRRWFPTTKNQELAEIFGVSPRTVIRKAKELGLEKNPEWQAQVLRDHCQIMYWHNRKNGWKHTFPKGCKPVNGFKPGHKPTEEARRKQAEAMRRWALFNRDKLLAKARKAAETRKRNRTLKLTSES